MYQPRPVFLRRLGAWIVDLGIFLGILASVLQNIPGQKATWNDFITSLPSGWKVLQDQVQGHLAPQGLGLWADHWKQLQSIDWPTMASQALIWSQANLFWPSLVVIALSLFEVFIGASLGKFLLNCRIAPLAGVQGNLWVWLPRAILKQAPLILILIGLGLKDGYWVLSGLGLAALYFLSLLSLLGRKKQPLYDRISGTSVYWKKHLED